MTSNYLSALWSRKRWVRSALSATARPEFAGLSPARRVHVRTEAGARPLRLRVRPAPSVAS